MNQLPPQLQQSINYAVTAAKSANDKADAANKSLEAIAALLKQTTVSRPIGGGPPNIQYIENIPGRRVPFDFLATIPLGANFNTVAQSVIQVSQEGPFVAVSRYAIFLSQYQLQYTNPATCGPNAGAKATFFGRSYGRYRPIHSANDIMDGMERSEAQQQQAFPGTGAPHILSPSNGSTFRSMQTDFTVKFLNAGSSFPRSNEPVPSAFWTSQINKAFDLGALDVFERGEQLQFNVQPLHVNNPAYGNIQGFASGNALYPFLASGWDYIEGINDAVNGDATVDPVVRLPDGILIIGFHGYRIVQPAGSGQS